MSVRISFEPVPVDLVPESHPQYVPDAWAMGDVEFFYDQINRWVEIAVDGVDLFRPVAVDLRFPQNSRREPVGPSSDQAAPPRPGSRVPLVNVAVLGLGRLKAVREEGHTWLGWELGVKQIHFYREGTRVSLQFEERREGVVGQRLTADYDEIVGAWEGFAEATRLFLRENIPDLARHPAMGAWIRGEPATPDWQQGPWMYGGAELERVNFRPPV